MKSVSISLKNNIYAYIRIRVRYKQRARFDDMSDIPQDYFAWLTDKACNDVRDYSVSRYKQIRNEYINRRGGNKLLWASIERQRDKLEPSKSNRKMVEEIF